MPPEGIERTKEICSQRGLLSWRIHGTFVNFLDLSPAIQEDIITRLDMESYPAL